MSETIATERTIDITDQVYRGVMNILGLRFQDMYYPGGEHLKWVRWRVNSKEGTSKRTGMRTSILKGRLGMFGIGDLWYEFDVWARHVAVANTRDAKDKLIWCDASVEIKFKDPLPRQGVDPNKSRNSAYVVTNFLHHDCAWSTEPRGATPRLFLTSSC